MLYGLVLTGGKSERMKTDKASLEFHGKPMAEYTYQMLTPFCGEVFLSVREDQKDLEGRKGFPQIIDQDPYLNIGPLGGILSAFTQFSHDAWLVLACDLPLITATTLEYLVKHRKKSKMATTYISSHDQMPEPLCAIYEPRAFPLLKKYFASGQKCPRQFLINQKEIELLTLPDNNALDNINYPEEYAKIMDLKKKK